MRDLAKIRKDIDQVDKKILALFEKRMALAHEVGLYKEKHNLTINDEIREQKIIEEKQKLIKNKKLLPYYKEFMTCVFSISKSYQKQIIKNRDD